MVEMGAPFFFQETNTLRVVMGLEGSMDNGWSWDAAANWGRNTGTDGWTFDIDNARVSQTLDENICSTAPGAAIPCGDYFGVDELTQNCSNIFGTDAKAPAVTKCYPCQLIYTAP